MEWNDYPNVMPPFDNYFVEWVSPFASIRAASKWNGVHVMRFEGAAQPGAGPIGVVSLQCELYVSDAEQRDSIVVGPVISYRLQVGEDGRCFDARIEEQFVSGDDPQETKEFQRAYVNLMRPAFLATSFMHCHNVSVDTVAPPPKLAKAHRKRHGVPLVRFRTINIEPMRRILHSEGHAHESSIKKALHICRGHFRTYTPEKPLFGKIAGTVFVPMHARGSATKSVIIQQYNVGAPDLCA